MKTLSLTIVFSTLLLAGCTSGTYVSDSERGQFQKGTTTIAQVESTLGAPTSTASLVGGGKRDSYVYVDDGARPLDYVVIPPVSLFVNGGWRHTTTVNFDFDAQGVLVDTSSRRVKG
jgi:hypothetical protein